MTVMTLMCHPHAGVSVMRDSPCLDGLSLTETSLIASRYRASSNADCGRSDACCHMREQHQSFARAAAARPATWSPPRTDEVAPGFLPQKAMTRE